MIWLESGRICERSSARYFDEEESYQIQVPSFAIEEVSVGP